VAYATEELGFSEGAAEGMTKQELVDAETAAQREGIHDELDLQNAEDEEAGDHVSIENEEEPSAGSSSSTSENPLDKNGSQLQETESSTQSPVQDAESHSREPHQETQSASSTARSTGGGTRKTGQPQASPDTSSETKPVRRRRSNDT
jgi:hypothetical protein